MAAPVNSNNPNAIPIATQVLCSVADTAAAPSIIFGGGDVKHNPGTGIYGSASEINFSVGGVEVLALDSNGLVLPGDISLDEITLTSATASKALVTDADKKLVSSSTTATEIGYVAGVTSAIQTQINSKLASADFTDAAVTSKLITGFVSGAGSVAATDTILEAIDKLDGNIAAKAPLADPVFSNNVRIVGNLGVGNSAAATTPGSVTKKIEIFDAAGVSLGFIAVYDAIS